MQSRRSRVLHVLALAAVVGLAALAVPRPAPARTTIVVGGPGTPAPVVVAPPPAVVYAPPVVVAPPPRVVTPAPVLVVPGPYRPHRHRWHSWQRW
jgi:hypothetical protein